MLECVEKFICCFAPWTLDGSLEICKLRFSIMATLANPIEDPLQEFEYPQREAAFFYGFGLCWNASCNTASTCSPFSKI
jgi:hypothetical protein